MRIPCSAIFTAIVTICIFHTSALALDIIYPADKTSVLRSNFLIVKGGVTPPLEAMIVDVNGIASDPIDIGDEEYKNTFADFLILEIEWRKGKNTIVVNGLVDGKSVATAKADIYFSPLEDPLTIIPAGYKPFVMHVSEKEALCAPCHNMLPSAAQLKSSTVESNPCASCHKQMISQAFVHGPEGVFQCIDCHDSKDKSQRWQITKAESELCGECHIDKIDEFKQSPFVHGPVAAGNCIICHNPHSSAEPAQLNAPVNVLCRGCHSKVEEGDHVVRGVGGGKGHPLAKVKDPLSPGRKFSCVSCHNPHSGKTSNFFIRNLSGRFSLCQECHQK